MASACSASGSAPSIAASQSAPAWFGSHSLAAEEAVDVDQAGPRDDPLDRGAAVAGGERVGKLLLLGVERAEADMGGLGLDHVDPAAAPVEDRDAEAGAGADHAGDAVGGKVAGAGERHELVRRRSPRRRERPRRNR